MNTKNHLINILLVHSLSSSIFGGGEKITLDLISSSILNNHINWKAIIHSGGLFAHSLTKLKVPIYDLPIAGTYTGPKFFLGFVIFIIKNLFLAIPLARIIKKQKVNLIYATTRGALISSTIASIITRVPLIFHLHDTPRNLWFYAIFTLLGANKIVVPCQYLKAKLESIKLLGKFLSKKVVVIYNSFSLSNLKINNKSYIQNSFDLKNKFPIIISVGRIEEAKGQVDIILAIPSVIKKFPSARFIFVGNWENNSVYITYIQEVIKQKEIEDNVILTGFREDVLDFINAGDILLSGSRSEVFSVVILEAMALAKPIIATDVGGTREQVIDGITGYLIPCNSPSEIANKVIQMASNKLLMEEMGNRGFQKVNESLNMNIFITKMKEILYYQAKI